MDAESRLATEQARLNLRHVLFYVEEAKTGELRRLAKWLESSEALSEDGRIFRKHLFTTFFDHDSGRLNSWPVCRLLLTKDPEVLALVREFETELNQALRSCVRRGNAEAAALLLEFGVDPSLMSPSPLFKLRGTNEPSIDVLLLLLRAGVDWAATEWDEEGYEVQEAAWHCIDWSLVFRGPEHMGPGYRTIEQKLRLNLQLKNQGEPGFHDLNESRYNECISLLAAVREAGSWKGYVNAVVIAPQKELLTLRTLCFRGRARPPPELARLFDPAVPNDVVWVVLQFWALAY